MSVFFLFNGSFNYNSCTDVSSFKKISIRLSGGYRNARLFLYMNMYLEWVNFRGYDYKVKFSFKCY